METAAKSGARLVRSELLFRELNEQIERLRTSAGAAVERIDFLCECTNASCTSLIALTLDEYEAVRRVPTHFVAVPGHEFRAIERVVDEISDYIVLEKHGSAGEKAAAADPRARPPLALRPGPARQA